MASRAQNEQKFKNWEELPNGRRRYTRELSAVPVDAPDTTEFSRCNDVTL